MSDYGGSAKEAGWHEPPAEIIEVRIGGKTVWSKNQPSQAQLEQWMDDMGGCEAVGCGCWVEPDGVCECGNPSWLLHLGLI